jgi:predicted nucleotidyltransferase
MILRLGSEKRSGETVIQHHQRSQANSEIAYVQDIVREVIRIVERVTGDPSFQVRLFGSWADGTARPHSDIDIAIDGPRAVDPVQMAEIRDACDRLRTLFTIDLVDLARASAGFRSQVRRQAGLVRE